MAKIWNLADLLEKMANLHTTVLVALYKGVLNSLARLFENKILNFKD